MAHTYCVRGEPEAARRFAEEALATYVAQRKDAEDAGAVPQWLDAFEGVAFAYAGQRARALVNASRLAERLLTEPDSWSEPYQRHQLARIYLLVGKHELALDEIEKILAQPYSLSPGWMRLDPMFDPVRDHPRFRALVEQAS